MQYYTYRVIDKRSNQSIKVESLQKLMKYIDCSFYFFTKNKFRNKSSFSWKDYVVEKLNERGNTVYCKSLNRTFTSLWGLGKALEWSKIKYNTIVSTMARTRIYKDKKTGDEYRYVDKNNLTNSIIESNSKPIRIQPFNEKEALSKVVKTFIDQNKYEIASDLCVILEKIK